MENLQFGYPLHYLAIIALIALAFALGLYLRDKKIKENKSWLPFFLSWVRYLAVFGILFLLLEPLIRLFESEQEKPIIVFLEDQSASIQSSTEEEVFASFGTEISSLKAELSEDYLIEEFTFGETIKQGDIDSVSTLTSNISGALEYISDSYEDQNLGAIILSTDGIFNEGKNPIYADMESSAPIHIVPLGDTTIRTDLLIKNILHNRIVYLNDKFIIETDIQAYNSKGNKSRLILSSDINGQRKVIDSREISISSDDYFESYQFELQASQVGNVKYILELRPLNNEISVSNNRRNIYLEVLDARQKILLVCHAPHPDIKAIKDIVLSNKNYEIDVVYAIDALPSIAAYDIILLHNLPSDRHKVPTLLNAINQSRKPVMFIVGNETDQTSFNAFQSVLAISGENFSVNNVTPIIDPSFSIFTLSDELKSKVSSFVPLKAPFGDYIINPSAKVLLKQRIGNVETDYPLLAYSDLNNHRQSVLSGEGIWRWRLMEYFDSEDQNLTKELLLKSIQFISQKEDKRQFRAFSNKNNYRENEEILLDAQLYNENFELINTPESFLTIRNAQGESFEYTFSKSDNYYFVNAGRFPEGNYRFTANTNFNGKSLEANGKFSVQSILKESFDLTAKHGLLYQLAEKQGGTVKYPGEITELRESISSNDNIKTVLYQKSSTKSLLEWRWILAAIIALLGLEWILRRYFGAY